MDVSKAKPQQVQQLQAAKRTEQVQVAQRREAQARAQSEQAQAQKTAENKPRPNVNGQGQTIGTRLSVTA
jgi:hypothetical protein